jgi:hypothetical protein
VFFNNKKDFLDVNALAYRNPEKVELYWPWGKCYQTFLVRNLLIFVISQSVFPGKPFLPSLLFVGKVRSLAREEYLKGSSIG